MPCPLDAICAIFGAINCNRDNSVSISPYTRQRRLRRNDFSRRLMREQSRSASDFIYPMFVVEGEQQREAIASMRGIDRVSIDLLLEEA